MLDNTEYRVDVVDVPQWMWLLCAISLVGFTLAFTSLTRAQDHHAMGHADYSGWSSEKTANCCNNQDCGDLEDTQWKSTPTGDQILIKGKWCPVEKKHYTTRGKSPDWRKAHACIQKNMDHNDPCDALLCFMGNGGI